MQARAVLRDAGLAREQLEMRHHEPETHQSNAGANPREKRSLLCEIIPQISPGFFSDGDVHFALTRPAVTRSARHRGRERAVPMPNVLGIPEMTWRLLLSSARFCAKCCRIGSPTTDELGSPFAPRSRCGAPQPVRDSDPRTASG